MTHIVRLGIAGLGTVGCGVVDIVGKQAAMLSARTGHQIDISAVSSRDRSRDRGIDLTGTTWVDDTLDLATHADVDVVVELIGGSEGIAYELCKAALENGKHVVTANKALIAHHGAELAALADKHNVQLMFEAAVAGGIPIIKLIKEGMAANAYGKIMGILNGTCNYILSTMEQTGRQFDDVLAEAQELGYAEADPSFDVDGVDASHKICILSALAYGTTPDMEHLYCEGIRTISATDINAARELGYVIRLIGVTQRTDTGITLRVHPALLHKDHVIAGVDGVYNAVYVEGDAVGDIFIKGAGAGREATASAVVADIMDIARSNMTAPLLHPTATLETPTILPMGDLNSAYYIRLSVQDDSGVLATITDLFAKHDISVATLIQHDPQANKQADITITTHHTQEARINTALDDIAKLDSVLNAPCMIRIED